MQNDLTQLEVLTDLEAALNTLRAGRPDCVPDYERLVDPLTGLIRWVRQRQVAPEAPVGITSWSARGADARRIGEWPADPTGGGDGLDPEKCRLAAIGEFVERYCGNYVGSNLRKNTYHAEMAAGMNPLDPETLALFSARQYQEPGFPFVPFSRQLPVNWVDAVSLVTGDHVSVPASLVWVNYIYGRYINEPRTNFQQFSGLATGASLRDAARSGLAELIERDATMMWWHGNYEIPLVDPEGDSVVKALTVPRRPEITWNLTAIPSEFGIPVIGALMTDERDGITGMGFACKGSAADAAIKAIAEAVQLRTLSLQMQDPNGKIRQSIKKGVIHSNTLRPYRADRKYADSFRSDYKDVTDLAHQSQIYLDRRMWHTLERVTATSSTVTFNDMPRVTNDLLDHMVSKLAARGMDVLCVDVTTPDIAEVGLWVVRVIVPGLLPNGTAGLPFLGGSRLYDVPVANGWRSDRLSEEGVYREPLPHS